MSTLRAPTTTTASADPIGSATFSSSGIIIIGAVICGVLGFVALSSGFASSSSASFSTTEDTTTTED